MSRLRILVLCTGNSCRSQIAEGFLREFGDGKFEVYSAGLTPKGVHPLAVATMADAGIDISHHTSNNLREYLSIRFDFVITVCDNAAEQCPNFPGEARRLHWPFEDPAHFEGTESEVMSEFRRVRDQIRTRCQNWVTTLSRQ